MDEDKKKNALRKLMSAYGKEGMSGKGIPETDEPGHIIISGIAERLPRR